MINSSKNAKQHANYLHHSTGRGHREPTLNWRPSGFALTRKPRPTVWTRSSTGAKTSGVELSISRLVVRLSLDP